jgi:hypothetical protein
MAFDSSVPPGPYPLVKYRTAGDTRNLEALLSQAGFKPIGPGRWVGNAHAVRRFALKASLGHGLEFREIPS